METELLFEITANLDKGIGIHGTPQGDRLIVYVTGGSFEGPKLKGEVLPGGGDWFLTRPDGIGVLDVRIVLKTDDGELIYMIYNGLLKRSKPGAPPDWLRTAPTFQTSTTGKCAWLNGVQAIGEGEAVPGGVRYRVYMVK